jgi:hypothetical protein
MREDRPKVRGQSGQVGPRQPAVVPQDRQKRDNGNRDPRRHGGQRGAGQFQVQTEDQDRVEHGIHQPAPDRRHHRAPRRAMGAQDRAAHHAHQQKRQDGTMICR